jgi:hypothetical protein
MKGVVLGIAPGVRVVDISHGIAPQNLVEAAYVLQRAYLFFPRNTVHVVVVDPGVGTGRPILALRTEAYLFLAPDNGVLTLIRESHPGSRIYQVTDSSLFLEEVSATFHGRDIFAPVAARLSIGLDPGKLGREVKEMVMLDLPRPVPKKAGLQGEVVYFDRFGNGVTNISGSDLAKGRVREIRVGSLSISGVSRTFGDAEAGEVLALIGSGGHLEIAVSMGNARESLCLATGAPVVVVMDRHE